MLAAADSTGINLSEKADGKSRYITGAQISWQNGSSWAPVSFETLIPLKQKNLEITIAESCTMTFPLF